MLSIKRDCQEIDDDDYCAVREKDKEYLKLNVDTALLSRTVIVKVMVAMVTRLDKDVQFQILLVYFGKLV